MKRILQILGFALVLVALVILFATYHLTPASGKPPNGCVVYSSFYGRWLPQNRSARYDLFLSETSKRASVVCLTSKSEGVGAAVWYPIFSPDGKFILVEANDPPGNIDLDLLESPTYRAALGLKVISVSQSRLRAIPDRNGYEHPSWSPDSKFISMVSPSKLYGLDTDREFEDIFVWDMGKAAIRRLVRVSGQVDDLFWSLDGRDVLFQLWSNEAKQDPNLYGVPRSGGKLRVIVKGKGETFGYSFSPDGRKLVFVRDNAVYIAKADGTDSSRAVEFSTKGSSRDRLKPRWSAAGDKIAVADVVQDSNPGHHTLLHVYNPVDRRDRTVATLPQQAVDLIWSRDGKWLLLKTLSAGNTEKPDPKTGGFYYWRDGLVAVGIADGRVVTLKEPNEETKGLDWHETAQGRNNR